MDSLMDYRNFRDFHQPRLLMNSIYHSRLRLWGLNLYMNISIIMQLRSWDLNSYLNLNLPMLDLWLLSCRVLCGLNWLWLLRFQGNLWGAGRFGAPPEGSQVGPDVSFTCLSSGLVVTGTSHVGGS